MTTSALPEFSPAKLGLSLEDLLGPGNVERLSDELGSGRSELFIHNICRGVAEGVRGKPSWSIQKRERAKKVMDAIIEDIHNTPDVFGFRYRLAESLATVYIAFLCGMYSEPGT